MECSLQHDGAIIYSCTRGIEKVPNQSICETWMYKKFYFAKKKRNALVIYFALVKYKFQCYEQGKTQL